MNGIVDIRLDQRRDTMRRYGTISYNIYCNFTNYGSALQTWALHQAIKQISDVTPILVDYCPDVLADKDPLNPFKNMWDQDPESLKLAELTLPAIRENFYKFDAFYNNRFVKTKQKYTSANFNEICEEGLDGFVCGSDTIFCIDEFNGFDDGYYANYPAMKNGYTVAYAASFGDAHFNQDSYQILNDRLQNFKAIGLRENKMISYVKEHTDVPVFRTIDPTLLLTADDYDTLAAERQENDKYLLLYTRRYNVAMEKFAEDLAAKNGWKVVEISLRATNAEKGHRMFYEAGVEEFLSLTKYAEAVVTNSFHGLIFAVQYSRPFYIFSREQGDSKIGEVLELFGLRQRLMVTGAENISDIIDYKLVHERIAEARVASSEFLKMELEGISESGE